MQPVIERRHIVKSVALSLLALSSLAFRTGMTSALAQEPDPATRLYVREIGVGWRHVGGPRKQPVAVVDIVDGYGQPVNGVFVKGDWSGCFRQRNDSAYTDTVVYTDENGDPYEIDGRAIIEADKTHSCWGGGQKNCLFTFTITAVSRDGMTYVPVAGKTSAGIWCDLFNIP